MLKEQLKQISATGFSRLPKTVANILTKSIEQLKQSEFKNSTAKIGDKVKDFQLLNIEGQQRTISALITKDYLVLNFYRGGWCTYCNVELRAYEQLKAEFGKLKTNIVAISVEKTETAIHTASKNSISYPILTDVNANFSKSIGIVFTLSEALKKEYTNFGIDLSTIHNNPYDELPVPAVYVINKKLEIVYAHVEEDYMTRLEPQELLDFIKNMK